MGKYTGEWNILIGFKGEHLKDIAPVIERLKKEYPAQQWNIMNSKFKQYDFILCGFADDRDSAHKIGLSLVKKQLPTSLNLLYWIKEVGLLKYNVKAHPSISTATNQKT